MKRRPCGRLVRSLCTILAALVVGAAHAEEAPIILIVSQPGKGVDTRSFVDLAPWVSSQLKEVGRFRPLVYKESLQAVRQALDAKALAPSDLITPLTKEAERKIARAVGAAYVLLLSGRTTKEGLAADAEMEMLTGQQAWSVVFAQQLAPYRSRGPRAKSPSMLEGIHAHAATIVQQITQAPVRIPVSPSVDVRTGQVISGSTPPTPPAQPGAADKPAGTGPAKPTPAITAPPSRPEPTTNEILVDRFRKQGDMPNLIVALRRAVNDKPRDAKLREQLVRAYEERGWDAAAADEASRAVSASPDSAALHRLLGDCCKALGQAEQAVAEYEAAVKLDGKDPENHVALGDGYWNTAKPEAALKCYASAIQADPKSPLAHRRLARIYVEMGRFTEGVAELNAARALTPPDDAVGLDDDYAAVMGVVEADLSQVLARLQGERQDLVSFRRTREQVFAEASDLKKRADELAVFLDALQSPARYARVHSLYVQAASLVGQAAELTLRSVETVDTSKDEEATLLRVEAGKQLADAAARLKAVRTPPAASR